MKKLSRAARDARELLVYYISVHIDPKSEETRNRIRRAFDILFDDILGTATDQMLTYVDNSYDIIHDRITDLCKQIDIAELQENVMSLKRDLRDKKEDDRNIAQDERNREEDKRNLLQDKRNILQDKRSQKEKPEEEKEKG